MEGESDRNEETLRRKTIEELSGGYKGHWGDAFTSAIDASTAPRSKSPSSPRGVGPKPPQGAKRAGTAARPPAVSRKVINKKSDGTAAPRKSFNNSLHVDETESLVDEADSHARISTPLQANDNERGPLVYNKERLVEISKPRVSTGLSLIQGSHYSTSSHKRIKSKAAAKKAAKKYFKPVQRIKSSKYGLAPRMFLKSKKEKEREKEREKSVAPPPEWKSPGHLDYGKVVRDKVDFRAKLREKSRELQALYEPREMDRGNQQAAAIVKDMDEKEVGELINDIINDKESPLKKSFFEDIEHRIVINVPKATPINVWLKKPSRPATAPPTRGAAKRAAQLKRSVPSPPIKHRSNNDRSESRGSRGDVEDGKSVHSNGRSVSPTPFREKRWTVAKKEENNTSLPLEWSKRFGEKGRRAKHQEAQAASKKIVLAPTGLPEDFVIVMHEMVYNVVERLLNTIRSSRDVAFTYKELLAGAVGLDGKIRDESDPALQRMLTVVGMANKGYSPLEAGGHISSAEMKLFDEFYLGMEGQEKALLDAIQLVSCTPNHRPMEDLTTVLLWLLSSNHSPDPAVDSDSDGRGGRDARPGSRGDDAVFMPIEREGGAVLLRTFTGFVEGALRDLMNVNTSAEYRGPDGVQAERSRVGKSKSLFHWYDSSLVDSEEVGAACGGAYSHIAQEVMASRGHIADAGLQTKTAVLTKQAEKGATVAASSSPRSPRESRRSGGGADYEEGEEVSQVSSLTLGLEELATPSRLTSPSKFSTNGNHQSITKTLLGTEIYSPSKNTKLEPARPLTLESIRKLGIIQHVGLESREQGQAAGKALTKFSYDQVQLQVHVGMHRFAHAMRWLGLTRASAVTDSQKSTSRLLSKFRGSIATVDCCESSEAEAVGRERRGRRGVRIGDDNFDAPQSTFDASNLTAPTVYNTERMSTSEKQALFHKLAPHITREQSNMLLTAIVSDTARTMLLCLAVLLKYTAAGKEVSTDDMKQLFCSPVVRAVGARPLQKLHTWLRNNRRTENGFRPAQHLSYLEAVLQRVFSFWPDAIVSVLPPAAPQGDLDGSSAKTAQCQVSVQLHWPDRYRVSKLFAEPHSFLPNLNNV